MKFHAVINNLLLSLCIQTLFPVTFVWKDGAKVIANVELSSEECALLNSPVINTALGTSTLTTPTTCWLERKDECIDLTPSAIEPATMVLIKNLIKQSMVQPGSLVTIIKSHVKPAQIWQLITALNFLIAEKWLTSTTVAALAPAYVATYTPDEQVTAAFEAPSEPRLRMIKKTYTTNILMHTMKPLIKFTCPEPISRAKVSPNGVLLATENDLPTISLWNIKAGSLAKKLEGHSDKIIQMLWTNDSNRLISASLDKTIKIWDVEHGTCLQTITAREQICGMASNGISILIFGTDNQTINIWDLTRGTLMRTQSTAPHDTAKITCAPTENPLIGIINCDDGVIRLEHIAVDSPELSLTGHNGLITQMAWTSDGKMLASADTDNTVRIWNTTTGAHRATLKSTSEINALAWSPDNTQLAVIGDTTGFIWRSKTGFSKLKAPKSAYALSACALRSVAWHPTSTHVVTTDSAGTSIIWKTSTCKPCTQFLAPTAWHLGTNWTSSGDLVAAHADGTIQVFGNTEEQKSLSALDMLLLLSYGEKIKNGDLTLSSLPEVFQNYLAKTTNTPSMCLKKRSAHPPVHSLMHHAHIYSFLREMMIKTRALSVEEIERSIGYFDQFQPQLQQMLSTQKFGALSMWIDQLRPYLAASSSAI